MLRYRILFSSLILFLTGCSGTPSENELLDLSKPKILASAKSMPVNFQYTLSQQVYRDYQEHYFDGDVFVVEMSSLDEDLKHSIHRIVFENEFPIDLTNFDSLTFELDYDIESSDSFHNSLDLSDFRLSYRTLDDDNLIPISPNDISSLAGEPDLVFFRFEMVAQSGIILARGFVPNQATLRIRTLEIRGFYPL